MSGAVLIFRGHEQTHQADACAPLRAEAAARWLDEDPSATVAEVALP